MNMSAPKAVTAAIIGAGHRSICYADYSLRHPDKLRIVAIAEPDPVRRRQASRAYNIPEANQFKSYVDIARRPGLCDAAINGTMDRLHYASTMPLIEAGYHVLLEKPIAPTEREVRELIDAANNNKRVVMICHVLRYAPFYRRIKDLLDEGAIGQIMSLSSCENVDYSFMAACFVRGKWRQRQTNPMMLSKCCHDLDIIAWLMSGRQAKQVASFGSLQYFRPENAPPGSTERCLGGCRVEPTCPYSAHTNYIVQGLSGTYVWESIEHLENPTTEQKLESLRTDNPYGRCAWRCDNDVVDRQNVIVEFDNGATAVHNLFTNTARTTRTIQIVGTEGEIEGDLKAGVLRLRKFRPLPGQHHSEEAIDVNIRGAEEDSGHGGGDSRLIADFVSVLQGNEPSKSVTNIADSLTGHLMAFAADTAMRERRVVEIAN